LKKTTDLQAKRIVVEKLKTRNGKKKWGKHMEKTRWNMYFISVK